MSQEQPSLKISNAVLSALSRIGEIASSIGQNVVDVSGFLEDVVTETQTQLAAVQETKNRSSSLAAETAEMAEAIEAVQAATADALTKVERSTEALKSNSERSRDVAGWVERVGGDLNVVGQTLGRITKSNFEIAAIAKQVNILAVNAKIEAARAGEFGRGFSVVAEAINELSQQTASAASGISQSIEDLNTRVRALCKEASDVETAAQDVLRESESTDETLSLMRDGMASADTASQKILHSSETVRNHVTALDQTISSLSEGLEATSVHIGDARQRIGGLVEVNEALIQRIYAMGGQNEDADYIELAQDTAFHVSGRWTAAIADGRIRENELFSTELTPIMGSDPEQYMAPYSTFADQTIQEVLDAPLGRMERLVGSGVQARHGYMPTMTSNISKPLSDDPVWNAANCRNRRVWTDRVGSKSGRNTEPFLLQTYRRDMGGGTFVMMNDVSAPIIINGRHWGGVRILFRPISQT